MYPTTDDFRPKQRTIAIQRGDSFEYGFRVKTNGVAQDLTNYSFAASVRRVSDGATIVLFQGDGALGSIVTVDTTTRKLSISAANTAVLLPGTHRYDIQATFPDGTKRTLLSGSFVISNDITTV